MMDSISSSSTRPYLLRALYEWCLDNGLTPYVVAFVDAGVRVPPEHVKNNEIVLNISAEATSHLKIDNEHLQFKARFCGMARDIVVPVDHIIAIYARENGQGMAFPAPALMSASIEPQNAGAVDADAAPLPSPSPRAGDGGNRGKPAGRPALTRVK